MRSLGRTLFATAVALGAAGASSMAAIGCGGSTSGTGPNPNVGVDATSEGGEEGGEDAPSDNTVSPEAETGVQNDASDAGDSGGDGAQTSLDAADSSQDANDAATGADGALDADGAIDDGAVDADGAVLDAAVDADAAPEAGGPPGLVFAQAEALALAKAALNCCAGGLDSGVYDYNAFAGQLSHFGWEGTLPLDPAVYTRGHVTMDQTKAAACLAAVQNYPCPGVSNGFIGIAGDAGAQTAAKWKAITDACELVFTGDIPSGTGGCISSFECSQNTYCDTTVDGGLCTVLAQQGQPCNTKVRSNLEPLADQMCSYQGSDQQNLYCDLVTHGQDAAVCQPRLAPGTVCADFVNYWTNVGCSAGLCGDDGLCGHNASYPIVTGTCDFYTIKDAGGGG